MAWIIDRDYLDSDPATNAVGTRSPGGEPVPNDLTAIRFRLRDDDGETYYGGRATGDDLGDDDHPDGLYGALRWGEWFAGCTDLELHPSDAIAHGLTTQAYVDSLSGPRRVWVSIYG